jgi:hypothetical protein
MSKSLARAIAAVGFMGVLAGVVAGAPFQAVNQMPAGYWNLDDTASPAVDAIAGANGTWNGNPVRVTTALPAFSYGNKSALQFSTSAGVDQYVEMPNTPVLDAIQNDTYSISAWCKPLSKPPGSGSANDAGYGFVLKDGYSEGIMYDANQHFEFQHWLTGNVWSGTGGWGATTPPGAWYHVVAVWDNAAGVVQMWINGVMQGSSNITANTPNRNYGTSKWRFGIQYPGAGNYRWQCDGLVDDVRLYNYALNGNQINVLYSGCPTPTGLTATPAGTQVNLSWTAPTGPAVTYTYNVKRGIAVGAETLLQGGVSGTTFTDTTGTPGTTYYYVVTAVSVAESGPSNEVNCRTVPMTVTPTAVTVVEAGGIATFTVKLLAPLANGATLSTTATVTSGAPSAPCLLSIGGGAMSASLPINFTGNGTSLLSQDVTITGVDDFIAANPWTATITFSTVSSTDSNFAGATLPSVTCNQIESDFPGVIVNPTSLSITNGGPPVQFTVQLASKPLSTVTLTLGVSMPLATVAGLGGTTTPSFTNATWNAPQTITLTPLSVDTSTTYISSFDVTFTPISGDASYQGLAAAPLPVFEPTSIPPLKKVWKCGLLGLEVAGPLLLLALLRRRRRRV